jgi:hypothetical protein
MRQTNEERKDKNGRYLHGGTSNYDDPKIFYVDLRTYAVRSELDERAAEPLPLDQLKLLFGCVFC